ncbi:MAG: hypothetical protein MUF29_05615 [Chitinophagaceae bacterium]|nr:hypothetical protein [Chitinophagaceae bacterium]
MFVAKPIQKFVLALLGLACFPAMVSAQGVLMNERRAAKAKKNAEKAEEINKIVRAEEEGAIVYNKEWVLGGRLYSDGWGVFYQHGKMKSVTKTNWWSLEFGERKHPKEEKLSTVDGSGSIFGNNLVYGKQNVFLFTKVGFGQQLLLGGKGNKNGVAVSAVYGGGLSLGLLKPYYVDLNDPLDGQMYEVKYKGDNSRTDSLFLDPQNLYGSSGFFKGVNETQVVPGVFGKGGLRFDYGRYNELVSAIQVGVNFEYYFKHMPIMALNEANKFFMNVFVGIEFGRRK